MGQKFKEWALNFVVVAAKLRPDEVYCVRPRNYAGLPFYEGWITRATTPIEGTVQVPPQATLDDVEKLIDAAGVDAARV